MVTGDTDFQGPVVMSIDHGVTKNKHGHEANLAKSSSDFLAVSAFFESF